MINHFSMTRLDDDLFTGLDLPDPAEAHRFPPGGLPPGDATPADAAGPGEGTPLAPVPREG